MFTLTILDVCKLPDVCGQNYTTFDCANINGIPYCTCPTGFYNDTTAMNCLLAKVTYTANVTLTGAIFTQQLNNPKSVEFINQAKSFCDQVKLCANLIYCKNENAK